LCPAVLAVADGACVSVTRATLSSIQPYSIICPLSSTQPLRFRGVNLTGVHFSTLKSRGLISFDEACVLDGVVINKLLVNQDSPKKSLSFIRFQLDTPLKDVRINTFQVGGRVQVNKRVIRSTFGVFVGEGDINFTLPVTYSSFGSLTNGPTYNRFLIRFFDRVVQTTITSIVGGKRVVFYGTVLNSRIDSITTSAVDGAVQIQSARRSTFPRMTSWYIYIRGSTRCSFEFVQGYLFVSIESVTRCTFSKVWGQGFYTAGSFSRASVYLSSISDSVFENIEAGTDGLSYHNDYEINFDAPVSDSTFEYLQGYPRFRDTAPLLRSSFSLINSSSYVTWSNQMTDTTFGTVISDGNIFILSNLSTNIGSTFGDLRTPENLAFNPPIPMQLTCSSISAKGCSEIVNRQLVPKPCPVCI